MLMEMVKIGVIDKGGNIWLVLFDEDVVGCFLLIEWVKKINFLIYYDEIGNLILRCVGFLMMVLFIVMGSYLDIQFKGGCFDGIYGVLLGMEVLQCLMEEGIYIYYFLEVVVWINEEGVCFILVMMGFVVFIVFLLK